MKNIKLINFFKEEHKKDKIFCCIFIILIYLLSFQCYSQIKSINNLKYEINQIKLSNKQENIKLVNSINNSNYILSDISDVYNLIGAANIHSLSVQKNKIKIDGCCKSLSVVKKLKSMNNIQKFSLNSIQNKNNKIHFNAVYEVGGIK